MSAEHWNGHARVERPTCCRWCPCCNVESNYDRKGAREGDCNVTGEALVGLDAVHPDCPGNVVVQVQS